MGKKMKGLAALLLACGLAGGWDAPASLASLDAVGEDIRGLEGQKAREEARLEALSQDQAAMYRELAGLDRELAEAAGRLAELEAGRTVLSASLESLEKEQEAAQERKLGYLEGMKQRIRFFYENGGGHLPALLLQAESLTDIWGMGRYLAEIHAYDRKMLAEYQEACADLQWKEDRLRQERQELEALGEGLSAGMAEAQGLVTGLKAALGNTGHLLGQAQAEVGAYEALIASQKEYERELEAEQERREREMEWQGGGPEPQWEGGTDAPYRPGGDDLDLLAAIIECEACGESYEGKLAVGSVVLNRTRSPRFPDSLLGVLYQKGQFTPVGSGRFAAVLARGADSACYQAAAEVLAGRVTLGSLFFRTDNGTKQGTVIGNHVFY